MSGPSFSVQGEGLSTYSQGGYADSNVANLISEAKANGSNFVEFSNARFVDLATSQFSDAMNNGVDQTAPLADIGRAIDLAQSQGMSVMLKPQVEVNDPAYAKYNSASWINMVDPNLTISDPAKFFANYKAELMQWANLAEQHHVAMLSIGNEMVAATKPQYESYWEDIIASVRQVYHGQLTYAALAPVVTNAGANEISQIGFWSKLDVAGFDVYPSLVSTATPTEAQIEAGWHNATVYGNQQDYAAFLNQMAQAVGKPVIFTETGLPSFSGASDRVATSDGNINDGQHPANQQEQADWWQAFYKTWAVNTPSWLKGLIVNNNDPGDLGSYYATNYNINGKLAEAVISAWYGGKTSIAPLATTLQGSQADDQLYTFGPLQTQATSLAKSLATTVEIKVTGAILNGQAPVLHVYLNGVDEGQVALKPVDSGYVDSSGVHYTTTQTYTFSLPGLVSVNQLQIVEDSAATVNGKSSSTFFHEVSVDGVALTNATYTPLSGNGGPYAQTMPVNGQGGNVGQWAGGTVVFDGSPWNSALAASTAGSAQNPILVNGQGGNDAVHVLGPAADYGVTLASDGTVHLTESSGLNQNEILSGISQVVFGDGTTVQVSSLSAGQTYHFGQSTTPTTPATPTAPAVTPIVNTEPFTLPLSGAPTSTVTTVRNGTMTGSTHNDLLDGHGSAHSMAGGSGDDTYAVYHSGDVVTEKAGAGIDTVASYSSAYTLGANVENGVLKSAGAQTLTGNSLNNDLRSNGAGSLLVGGAGNDILHAGSGADTMTGGTGKDVFEFSVVPKSAGHITDFTPGTDVLDLRGVFASVHYQGTNPLADGYLTFQNDGAGNTQVLFDMDGSAGPAGPQLLTTLDHINASSLNAGKDWVFA